MTLNVVLNRLKENIFKQPYASAGKNSRGVFAPARKASKSYALGLPNIQINGPRQKRYLSFDVDREYAALAWQDANLPIPNIIITNPRNGHAHLVYELQDAIWERRSDDTRPGEAQPIRYYKAVLRAMEAALNADQDYNGLLVKNPFHPDWVTTIGYTRPYTLGELSAHLELSLPNDTKLRRNVSGRNCTLFDSIRLWAYRAKSTYSDFRSFCYAIEREVEHLNSRLSSPVTRAELKGISKSVSTWVWNNYTGSGHVKRRGICNLDPSDSLHSRQRHGQAETCRFKVSKTLSRIQLAIDTLSKMKAKLTKSAVAKLSGLHRNTVTRHWQTASNTGTVTEGETEPLRGRSTRRPAGVAGLTARGGYPDVHRKVHSCVADILARIKSWKPPPIAIGGTSILAAP